MFDRVRDVYIRTVDTRLFERTAQQTAGRPDNWLPGNIIFIAGLFAHYYDARPRRVFTENRLRRGPVEFARFAFLRKIAQLRQRRTGWHERLSFVVLLRGGHINSGANQRPPIEAR